MIKMVESRQNSVLMCPMISDKNPVFSEILDATRNTMQKAVCQYFFSCSEKPLAVIIPLKNRFYLKNYVISKFIQYNHFNEHSYLRITKP